MRASFRSSRLVLPISLVFLVALALSPLAAAQGYITWTRQFGSTKVDAAFGLAVSGSDAFVVGRAGDKILPDGAHIGGQDAFLRKYWANGSFDWTEQFGTFQNDYAYGVAVGSSAVYVGGGTEGAMAAANAGYNDAFLTKRDITNGDGLWTVQFGTQYDDIAFGVAWDASGVYVVGEWRGLFLPDQTVQPDAFLRKYDGNGNLLWNRIFGTSAGEEARAVAVDSSGVYVFGYTGGALGGPSSGGADVFVRKHDTNGNHMWTRQFGSSGNDFGYSGAVDASGVYVAGSTFGTLPNQTSAGGEDAFVRKYDLDGNELWTRQFGTPSIDRARGVAADVEDPVVAGVTFGTLPGQSNSGESDAFVRRYDADGNEMWTVQYGTSEMDRLWAVTSAVMYVAGETAGTFPGEQNEGQHDAFLSLVGEEMPCDPSWPWCPNGPSTGP